MMPPLWNNSDIPLHPKHTGGTGPDDAVRSVTRESRCFPNPHLMKKTRCFLFSACLLGVFLGGGAFLAGPETARAELIAEDDFSKYTVGAPPESIGGKGWKTRWSIGPEATAVIEMAPGLDGVSQKCLRIGGKNTMRALIRRIADPKSFAGQPIYLRVVFEIVEGSSDSADLFSSWMFASDPASLSAGVTTGVKYPPTARIGESRKAVRKALETGRVYTLIARLSGWDQAAGQYTETTLWIDPAADAGETGQSEEARVVGAAGAGVFELLVFRIYELEGGAYRLFDVRLATTWDEVVQPR
jgi:hypothetical protein